MGTFGDEGVLVPDAAQLAWLAALSNHVAVAIDRVRFLGEIKEARDELRMKNEQSLSLLRLYRSLASARTYREIVDALMPEIESQTGFRNITLSLVEPDADEILILASGGALEGFFRQLMHSSERYHRVLGDDEMVVFPVGGDPHLEMLVAAPDIYVDPDLSDPDNPRVYTAAQREILSYLDQHSMCAVPIIFADRKIGYFVLSTHGDEGIRVPTEAHCEYLRALANHVAVALDRVKFLGDLRESRALLADSEQRYRRFVETTTEGVWAQDSGGVTEFVSDRMAEILGHGPQDMLGTPVRDLVFEDDLPLFDQMQALVRAGKPKTYELRLRRADVGVIWLSMSETPVISDAGDYGGSFAMATDITDHKAMEVERERLVRELTELLDAVVGALSATTSERDPYTAMHQSRVARLAVAIAERLGLPAELTEGLRVAALLHDIGKIAVPTEILSKPTVLTEMEMGIVRTHSSVGHRLLEGVHFPRPVSKIVLQHHERIDGSGYPDGLAGDETLLEAKILAVADVVEAMASHRPYRPALGIEPAMREIESQSGSKYDPDVVAACVEVVRADPAIL